jgi:hypothetical protein
MFLYYSGSRKRKKIDETGNIWEIGSKTIGGSEVSFKTYPDIIRKRTMVVI